VTDVLETFQTQARQKGSKRGVRYTAPSRRGFIYFIQIGYRGPVKIGFTSQNPFVRLRVLSASSPDELRLLGYFIGVFADEARAHSSLMSDVLRAEWFHPTERVFNYIRSKCPGFNGNALNEKECHAEIENHLTQMVAA
jgi:hypothetical protein